MYVLLLLTYAFLLCKDEAPPLSECACFFKVRAAGRGVLTPGPAGFGWHRQPAQRSTATASSRRERPNDVQVARNPLLISHNGCSPEHGETLEECPNG